MTTYNKFVTHVRHQRMPLSIEQTNISVDVDVDMLCTDGSEEIQTVAHFLSSYQTRRADSTAVSVNIHLQVDRDSIRIY